ncbi:MAG TPA: CBS domain-containing protein [Anaerolineaceae bacterium]
MENNSAKQGIVITDSLVENITRVEELAYELRVEEVMTRLIKSFNPEDTMTMVYETFRDQRISGAPVIVDDKLVGIVSMEDLMKALMAVDQQAPVSKYMTPNPITVHSTDPVVEALKLFVNTRHGRLPVIDVNNHVVGILTKGDITSGLLRALQRSYYEEELRRYRASHLFEDIISDRTSLILRYTIKPRDFTKGGNASSHIKRALLRLGANTQIARRCGIAVYEAEMNLIIHTTNGGVIRVEIESDQITIKATDDGPGIKDIALAMKPGYSTASEEIRELGFGAGMGLVNIQRCVDSMKLESTWGKGTTLEIKIKLPD